MTGDSELAQSHRAGVSPHSPRAAAAVFEVLPKKSAKCRAWVIFNTDIRIKKNAPAERTQTTVKLCVFVVRKCLVVTARFNELRESENSMMTMIDISATAASPMSRAAGPKRSI